jgi:hypothetical protein
VKPVEIEVVTYTPTVFYHCQHCEIAFRETSLGNRVQREEARDSLPDDLREQFQDMSDWIHGLFERFENRIAVKVVDAASIEGVWKSLRHRLRKYPAVMVDGKQTNVGGDFRALDSMIEKRVEAASR